jgi:hypothetical protein
MECCAIEPQRTYGQIIFRTDPGRFQMDEVLPNLFHFKYEEIIGKRVN